jgi:F420-non-reducing hydrogenase large subunit
MSNAQKEITITPTTRIEGHGKVTITLDEKGDVSNAFFYATEIRGFDYFLRGMDADRLPFIISRICGVCSTAHILASVKAIENVYETEITETARKLRELLMMGQIISNHSLVSFFLTLPDFWFSSDEDASKRNIFHIMQERPDLGKKAITLRMFGANILEVVGKRDVHIFSVIPGGIINSLKERERIELLKVGKEALSIAKEMLRLGKELFERNWTQFKKAGDYKTHYLGLTKNGQTSFYDGDVRIIDPAGNTVSEFNAQEYMEHIEEKSFSWTYAKFAFLKTLGLEEEIGQVGPSARMNVNRNMPTKTADEEMQEFKREFGTPTHVTLLFDYARLIELLYACERANELLEDQSLTHGDTRIKIKPRGGTGIGVVEAPRGTLAHEYTLAEDGSLQTLKLIIPTQINNAAINLNVKDAASEFIRHGEIKPGLLNRIEMVIRAYDPCIKCATRQANQNLTVEIRNSEGSLNTILSRKAQVASF